MAAPIVETKQGKVRGTTGVDWKQRAYYVFYGIPYAKPPVGPLRFKAPQPPESWEGVRDATTEASESVCKHMIFDHPIGSEDCLFINVFTPQLPAQNASNKLKPVMLWIHGGAFVTGSSKIELYSPDFLVSEDVVVVSINYRLGALGFLKLDDPALGVPGNAGFKDMVMALKWVRNNIVRFNGDPNNVTVFGESAGSAAVHCLVLSPMAKGLFHRAILQSGSALNPWMLCTENAKSTAKNLGYQSDSEKDVLSFLMSVTPSQLLEAQHKFNKMIDVDEIRPFGLTIETPGPNGTAFIDRDPLDIIASGDYNKVPMIIGYTDREGMLMEVFSKREHGEMRYFSDFERKVPYYYNAKRGTDVSKKVAKQIQEFYFKGAAPCADNIDQYYIIETDLFFLRGIYVALNHHLATSDCPIYFYRFGLDTELNLYKKLGNVTRPGACHADDLGYLFKTMTTPDIKPGSPEDNGVRRMVKLWANFARAADPNPEGEDVLLDVKWEPAATGNRVCLDIGDKLKMVLNPDEERMQFWDMVSNTSGINSKL